MKTKSLPKLGVGLVSLVALIGCSQTLRSAAVDDPCDSERALQSEPPSCPTRASKEENAQPKEPPQEPAEKEASQPISSGQTVSVSPSARPKHKRSDAPVPPSLLKSSPFNQGRSAEAMMEQLRGTAWEYAAKTGHMHRIDFWPDGKIAVYQRQHPGSNAYSSVEISQLSSETRRTLPALRTRNVTTGRWGQMPITELTDSSFVYREQGKDASSIRRFRLVGTADVSLPENAPQRLEDGFWRVRFYSLDKSPYNVDRNGLGKLASGQDRTISTSAIAGLGDAGFLVGPGSDGECRTNCVFIVNDFDRVRNRVRRRLIDVDGVAYVGARLEPSIGAANVVSLRAFDGEGGWNQWKCSSQRRILDCTPTGSKP